MKDDGEAAYPGQLQTLPSPAPASCNPQTPQSKDAPVVGNALAGSNGYTYIDPVTDMTHFTDSDPDSSYLATGNLV